MQKVAIGLLGQKLAGKGTVSEILKGNLLGHNRCTQSLRSSDILSATAKLWYIDRGDQRKDYVDIFLAMRDKFGSKVLVNAWKNRALRAKCADKTCKSKSKVEFPIFDGIRFPDDIAMLRSFPKSYLIYITAGVRTRWQRTRTRNEKKGEKTISFEKFEEQEKLETERSIAKLGKQHSDFTIKNDGDIVDLTGSCVDIVKQICK